MRGKESATSVIEKRGLQSVEGLSTERLAARRLIWVHAVSVGEVVSTFGFIERFLEEGGDDYGVLLTTSTLTSKQVVDNFLAGSGAKHECRIIHQFFPLDHQGYIARFIDYWRPWSAVWFEQELWPNALKGMRDFIDKRGSGVLFLVQARMSQGCVRRWSRPLWSTLARSMLGSFDVIYCQSRENMRRIGRFVDKNRKLRYAGDIKLEAALAGARAGWLSGRALGATGATGAGGLELAEGCFKWGVVSAHPQDEEAIIRCHELLAEKLVARGVKILTLVVHRHPTRARDFANKVDMRHAVEYFSEAGGGEVLKNGEGFYLFDTVGKMDYFLASELKQLVVGGSFSDKLGGHNPYELVAAGKAVIFGPHMENFQEGADELQANGAALRVESGDGLCEVLEGFLEDFITGGKKLEAQEKRVRAWLKGRRGRDPVADIARSFLGQESDISQR